MTIEQTWNVKCFKDAASDDCSSLYEMGTKRARTESYGPAVVTLSFLLNLTIEQGT